MSPLRDVALGTLAFGNGSTSSMLPISLQYDGHGVAVAAHRLLQATLDFPGEQRLVASAYWLDRLSKSQPKCEISELVSDVIFVEAANILERHFTRDDLVNKLSDLVEFHMVAIDWAGGEHPILIEQQ